MTIAPMAVVGVFEYFLIAVAVLMMVGVPFGVIVGLWLWQRDQRVRAAVASPSLDPRRDAQPGYIHGFDAGHSSSTHKSSSHESRDASAGWHHQDSWDSDSGSDGGGGGDGGSD